MSEIGKKYDSGKPKLGMVLKYFAPALVEVAKAGTIGCAKYGNGKFWDYNWNLVENAFERYTDALQRHFMGESADSSVEPHMTVDKDTGLLEATLVAWNALARLSMLLLLKAKPYSQQIESGASNLE